MNLSGSTGALRQARARTKGKARAYPRRARSDLQRVVGNVEAKEVFLRLQCDVRHAIDPFVGGARPIRPALTRFYSRSSRQGDGSSTQRDMHFTAESRHSVRPA